jgi:carbamoyltransferase
MSKWIAGVTRGHNGCVCLLRDNEIVFAIEEERLSRRKYDGGPYAAMVKILEYTKKLDYLVIAHTQPLQETAGKVDFSGDDVYTGLARKLGLIDRKIDSLQHPQVIDLSYTHHKLHAACAFYRSGFKEAVALVVDGAGTFIPMLIDNKPEMTWELESIITCNYPNTFKTLYKHLGGNGPWVSTYIPEMTNQRSGEEGTHELILDDTAGIVKAYEAVTQYCGWPSIEAGKTMGLSPYGKLNKNIPEIYSDAGCGKWRTTNRNFIIPTFPNGARVNDGRFAELEPTKNMPQDVTTLQNRRDMAYAVQTQSQSEVLRLIEKAVSISGIKNVVISGGYGLNCVANYYYLKQLKDKGINLYVEPISNDAGTAIGAAFLAYHQQTQSTNVLPYADSLYLGPKTTYTLTEINSLVEEHGGTVKEVSYKEVIDVLRKKNIVTIFQGKSENGPRALGNRSILFDPTFKDGKEFVNTVKHREYFRPFAGTVLAEHADKWFDMCGLNQSPHMMYAVDCLPEVAEKIPSIIHVDGTCRIQTVTRKQNLHFYNLIEEFYKQTNVPILFNTSFNLGGDPLVETLEDAVNTLSRSDIEYLYLPEHSLLITIPNNTTLGKVKKYQIS